LFVTSWSFLTDHARVLLRFAQDPDGRLRGMAVALGITERSAYGIRDCLREVAGVGTDHG
jgi:hypothetical protein